MATKEKVEYGIKETQEMLLLVFSLGKAVMDAKKDGFNAEDLTQLIKVIPYVAPAFDGASVIPSELKDLSKDEVKSLLVFTANQLAGFAGENKKLEEQVAKGLEAGLAVLEFIKTLSKEEVVA